MKKEKKISFSNINKTENVWWFTIENEKLKNEYNDTSKGIELVSYASVYKFVSKDVCYDYVQKLFEVVKTNELSQSALETLAIVAYKQPITRVEIEEIRGVGCDMMLRKLAMKNMVREQGRSDAPGRPILYEVTTEFLDSFKLISLDELPSLPNFNSETENEELF